MTKEEYEHIKEVGQNIGYLFKYNSDNLENSYELKNNRNIKELCRYS